MFLFSGTLVGMFRISLKLKLKGLSKGYTTGILKFSRTVCQSEVSKG